MGDLLRSIFKKSVSGSALTLLDVEDVSTEKLTVISLSLCNTNATIDRTFDVYIKDPNNNQAAGANTLFYLYQDESLPSKATFIHNDKLVLRQDEELTIVVNSGTDTHIHCSYLEQTA